MMQTLYRRQLNLYCEASSNARLSIKKKPPDQMDAQSARRQSRLESPRVLWQSLADVLIVH
jgi:hypothetical protein